MNEGKIKQKCKRIDISKKVVKGFLNKYCEPQTELYYSLETLLEELDKKDKLIELIYNLFYEYISIRPMSGIKFLNDKGFSKCKNCEEELEDENGISCKDCIKEEFFKKVEEENE